MSPLTNATLVTITTAGDIDDYGDPTGDGTDLWTGSAAAYLKRTRSSLVSGGQQLLVKTDTLTILDSAAAIAASVTAGGTWDACTVLIDDLRTGTPVRRRFQVQGAEHRAAGTIADSLRLDLIAAGD